MAQYPFLVVCNPCEILVVRLELQVFARTLVQPVVFMFACML
jgi:hypothetical protein